MRGFHSGLLALWLLISPGCNDDREARRPEGSELGNLNRKVESLRKEAAEKQASSIEIEREIASLEEAIEELETKIDEQLVIREDYLETFEKLRVKLDALTDQHHGSLIPPRELFEKLSKLNDELQKENADLRKQINNASK